MTIIECSADLLLHGHVLFLMRYLSSTSVSIDMSLAEIPRSDLISKQDIQLFVCASLALWQSKECPCEYHCCCTTPEETGLS